MNEKRDSRYDYLPHRLMVMFFKHIHRENFCETNEGVRRVVWSVATVSAQHKNTKRACSLF